MEEIHNKENLDAVEEFIHPQHIRHTNQTFGGGAIFTGLRASERRWQRGAVPSPEGAKLEDRFFEKK